MAVIQPRMMYSSSKDALKRALNGLAADIQANDPDDIEHVACSYAHRIAKPGACCALPHTPVHALEAAKVRMGVKQGH